MNGKLIVIEGLDGSGKATQTAMLRSKLLQLNLKYYQVSFPDYNSKSSSLVKMYLNSEFGESPNDVNAYAATSFFAVDRYSSYIKDWKEKYQSGYIIIADRYTTSNVIYQMSKLGTDDWDYYIDWMQDYEYNKLGLPKPDKVIYLDMPVEISQEFMNKRYKGDETKKDIHESNVSFLNNCRDSALYAAKRLKWDTIECSNNGIPRVIGEIYNEVLYTLKDVLK